MGDVIAKSVYSYFRDERHLADIERLRASGLRLSAGPSAAQLSDALAGKTIVISGNFSISREAMKELITRNGGKNSGSVSGKTSYLLAGSKPGPEKIKKAGDLGVEIIDEATFRAMIPGTAGAPAEAQETQGTLFDDEPTLF